MVEIKNLNSFKSLEGAVRYELAEQPRRWERDGREMGRGAKRTLGWDDARGVTVLQREKEDADDYRYFPDPDLVPVVVSERVAGRSESCGFRSCRWRGRRGLWRGMGWG